MVVATCRRKSILVSDTKFELENPNTTVKHVE